MFLKNANAYLYNRLFRSSNAPTLGAKSTSLTLVDGSSSADLTGPYVTSGDPIGSLINTLFATAKYGTYTSSDETGVVFGTGNRTPSIDDYTLSGDLIAGLTSSNVTKVLTVTEDDGRCSVVAEYTISNTTGADLTIGEIGLACNVAHKASSTSTNVRYSTYLLERTALEVPITIPAGGIGRVTYTITMPDPVV